MDVDKQHSRHCILFCFQMKKRTAKTVKLINSTMGENHVNLSTIQRWFARFRDNNFGLEDDSHTGAPKKVMDQEIQSLLNKNPCQTEKELAEQLRVTQQTISVRLHAMGKI